MNEDTPKVVVISNGINETILKYVTEEIIQESKMTESLVEAQVKREIIEGNYEVDYDMIYNRVLNMKIQDTPNIEDISSNNLSYTMIEFYTLIAMACLYGGILGMVSINQNLPNMTQTGKRTSISNTKKSKIILSSLLASYVIQIVGIGLLFVYTIFVLHVDYGTNLPLIILLGVVRKSCRAFSRSMYIGNI